MRTWIMLSQPEILEAVLRRLCFSCGFFFAADLLECCKERGGARMGATWSPKHPFANSQL